MGFGISTPEHARQAAAAGADGVIVGSRLVRAAAEATDPASAAGTLVAELSVALQHRAPAQQQPRGQTLAQRPTCALPSPSTALAVL